MSTTLGRQRIVFGVLLLISTLLFVGLEFGLGGAYPRHNASVIIAVVAFIKARLVISDFMELRGTTAMRLFDVWLLACCAACVWLILR